MQIYFKVVSDQKNFKRFVCDMKENISASRFENFDFPGLKKLQYYCIKKRCSQEKIAATGMIKELMKKMTFRKL